MNRWQIFPLLLALLFAPLVHAQDTECSTTNIAACRVDLTLYCQRQGAVPFSFSLDPNNNIESHKCCNIIHSKK